MVGSLDPAPVGEQGRRTVGSVGLRAGDNGPWHLACATIERMVLTTSSVGREVQVELCLCNNTTTGRRGLLRHRKSLRWSRPRSSLLGALIPYFRVYSRFWIWSAPSETPTSDA